MHVINTFLELCVNYGFNYILHKKCYAIFSDLLHMYILSHAFIISISFCMKYLMFENKYFRTCFEFLDQLLVTWPTHPMEKHVGILSDAIKKGISDADPEARAFSRK